LHRDGRVISRDFDFAQRRTLVRLALAAERDAGDCVPSPIRLATPCSGRGGFVAAVETFSDWVQTQKYAVQTWRSGACTRLCSRPRRSHRATDRRGPAADGSLPPPEAPS
jgi:hypothetical protein